jgi:polysaccharide biosynthesis/export protein
MKKAVCLGAFALAALVGTTATAAQGQSAPTGSQTPATTANGPSTTATVPIPAPGIQPPSDYLIGPEDVLEVVFWREKDLSGQVMVRPDGMVSLPLLNDVQAAGLTPEQFRLKLLEAAGRFVENPSAAVIVRTINSRKVYATGELGKPGVYPLHGPMTVMQLITLAGGFSEYADVKSVAIVRNENGKAVRYKFNYKDYARGKNAQQDIALKPGDTVIVP